MNRPRISMVAAMGENRGIGSGNRLLWHIPDDLKRFKQLTTGHPVIMGRKTFESIGKPLPGRTNIVVTRDPNWSFDGVLPAQSLEEAIVWASAQRSDLNSNSSRSDLEIFIIGGAQIYTQALPLADRLYLTRIEASQEADAFFPEYENLFTKKIAEELREWNGLKYAWVDLEKTDFSLSKGSSRVTQSN